MLEDVVTWFQMCTQAPSLFFNETCKDLVFLSKWGQRTERIGDAAVLYQEGVPFSLACNCQQALSKAVWRKAIVGKKTEKKLAEAEAVFFSHRLVCVCTI